MDRFFKNWKKVFDEFKNNVEKDISEIRKYKAEVSNLRKELSNEIGGGHIIRNDNRIVLSAPEIIIGNVDKSGSLADRGASVVIIRGADVRIEGVGPGGKISAKAPSIRQTAVDPGVDGLEEVAGDVSEIVSQAGSIAIEANVDNGLFTTAVGLPPRGGVRIHADSNLSLEASVKGDRKKKELEALESAYNTEKTRLKKEVDKQKKYFESVIDSLEELLDKQDKLVATEEGLRADIEQVVENNLEIKEMLEPVYEAFNAYSRSISMLAEVSRKITAVKEHKNLVVDGENYKKNSTGATVDITGERIEITSADGEGNLRDNPGSGVKIKANTIGMSAVERDGSLKPQGDISLCARNINARTFDAKDLSYDNNGKQTKGSYPATGNVSIKTKNLSVESLDYEFADNAVKEKALAKDGKMSIRFENIEMSTNETEGKATGNISMNSKEIRIKSIDVDKESREDKALAEGSSMILLSEKMFIGCKDKETRSKSVQIAAESVGTFAKTTFEVQQGEKKAIVQLSDGKAALSGDKTEIFGETTVNAGIDVKGEIKAPKAAIDSVEAKSAFKSPNISDGMAAGAGGGGGSLSAKIEFEDSPQQKKE